MYIYKICVFLPLCFGIHDHLISKFVKQPFLPLWQHQKAKELEQVNRERRDRDFGVVAEQQQQHHQEDQQKISIISNLVQTNFLKST